MLYGVQAKVSIKFFLFLPSVYFFVLKFQMYALFLGGIGTNTTNKPEDLSINLLHFKKKNAYKTSLQYPQ